MPSWTQFAWCAFLYKAVGGDACYQELRRNLPFLESLWRNPHNLDPQTIQDVLIVGFFNKWNTRVPHAAANPILEAVVARQPQLGLLQGLAIRTADLNGTAEAIQQCYQRVNEVDRIGPTATSKILHVLQPDLFVMWDRTITRKYRQDDPGIDATSQGYLRFLHHMQQVACELSMLFAQAGLPEGNPENYLSTRLQNVPHKTMAKYLDEYNWVTVTKGVDVPPDWHPCDDG